MTKKSIKSAINRAYSALILIEKAKSRVESSQRLPQVTKVQIIDIIEKSQIEPCAKNRQKKSQTGWLAENQQQKTLINCSFVHSLISLIGLSLSFFPRSSLLFEIFPNCYCFLLLLLFIVHCCWSPSFSLSFHHADHGGFFSALQSQLLSLPLSLRRSCSGFIAPHFGYCCRARWMAVAFAKAQTPLRDTALCSYYGKNQLTTPAQMYLIIIITQPYMYVFFSVVLLISFFLSLCMNYIHCAMRPACVNATEPTDIANVFNEIF